NRTLGIRYSYAWYASDRFGFVKETKVENITAAEDTEVKILDGLRNILPHGVNLMMQTNMSTLVDAYKKCELIREAGLGIYSLSSIPTDRAEPSEALKATVVWSEGPENAEYLLSTRQIDHFRNGSPLKTEYSSRGQRGAYFVQSQCTIPPGETVKWLIIAGLNRSAADIQSLIRKISKEDNLLSGIYRDIAYGTENLIRRVASSDGLQATGDEMSAKRHFSNTLFNIMRGGIYAKGYSIPADDFSSFVNKWNSKTGEKYRRFLNSLKDEVNVNTLKQKISEFSDPDFERLAYEYLPLTFSRRHGDPSRPWNKFSIDLKTEDGNENLNYQGNWRDIFQNWEALSFSYPEYTENIITKFVNASTADGYNPYRITSDGFDWEILDPDDPWSNIGYWGDHQVVYLLRLMELSADHHPGKLAEFLAKNVFVYANVPYRIAQYETLTTDPDKSIRYDNATEKEIRERIAETGYDGKLLSGKDGLPYKVNLCEKILLIILSKLFNFVPGGGIWMNTGRPEWNDANNALAGNGLSMVTLYYLRRFITFFLRLAENNSPDGYAISEEIVAAFAELHKTFREYSLLLSGEITDTDRKKILDKLGKTGEEYREKIYDYGFSERKTILNTEDLRNFLLLSIRYLDHSIACGKREDGLYHAYNFIRFENDRYKVEHLYEMLEGQVAILSSGSLQASEALAVLDALRSGNLYRKDQKSYTLYPDRELPGFLTKNIIPEEKVRSSQFLRNEIRGKRKRFIEKDINGKFRFTGSFRNAGELKQKLREEENISEQEVSLIGDLFEDIFDHHAFTGRSGSFFKYEGLGCIYWHMVSKLLLAAKEVYFNSLHEKISREIRDKIKEHYYHIREGLGTNKSPEDYGAFPLDPYSHTPSFAGVRQPGMTGQVKEDIISRFGELGIRIRDGKIGFNPALLKPGEFLTVPGVWKFTGMNGSRDIPLEAGSLGFSLFQVPVIYQLSDRSFTEIHHSGKKSGMIDGVVLDRQISNELFNRTGSIELIRVFHKRKTE
ncbi:MAG: hypothetical protein PVF73_13125, partial [Bacteroidales bacterium]